MTSGSRVVTWLGVLRLSARQLQRRWLESDSLVQDLDRRLAEGEIDRREYERLRARYRVEAHRASGA